MNLSEVIIPGEVISEKEENLNYAYIENGKTISAVMALYDGKKLIPLNGKYIPVEGDLVVGVVIDKKMFGYNIDIGLPARAFISTKETRLRLDIGDIILAKVKYVGEGNACDLTNPKKLEVGDILLFPATKVPRLIGKKNSMINTIKSKSGANIVIGRNGYIWIDPKKGSIAKARELIEYVSRNAHTSGLTDRVANL